MLLRVLFIITAIVNGCSSISSGKSTISNKVTLGSDYNNGTTICSLYIVTPEGTYFCGCTILKPSAVLTAGHCCKIFMENTNDWYEPNESIVVIAGTDNLKYTANMETQRVKSIKVYLPPTFNLSTPTQTFNIYDDACVIQLRDCLTLSPTVQEVKLPPSTYPVINHSNDLLVCGHGYEEFIKGGADRLLVGEAFLLALSDQLKCAELKLVDFESCKKNYYDFIKEDSHICAGGVVAQNNSLYVFNGKGACSGDSGGPLFNVLVKPINNVLTVADFEQVGIVSAGSRVAVECGNTLFPDIYTSLNRRIVLWILSILATIISDDQNGKSDGCYKCTLVDPNSIGL